MLFVRTLVRSTPATTLARTPSRAPPVLIPLLGLFGSAHMINTSMPSVCKLVRVTILYHGRVEYCTSTYCRTRLLFTSCFLGVGLASLLHASTVTQRPSTVPH